jgi:predicted transcriptional regulator
MVPRERLHSRDPGVVPRKRPPGIRHNPDNRLEAKKAVHRARKVGNFHIFEPAISRDAAQRKLIDELLALFGGRTQPVMAHLIETGKLTLADVKEAEKTLRKLGKKDQQHD